MYVWIQPGRPPTLRQGWTWGKSGGNIRWGTNQVAKSVRCDSAKCRRPATHHFFVDFTKPGGEGITSHEAQAVEGDSGGAVFAKNGEGEWELSGVMFSVHVHPSQPARATLDGNITFSVDLSRYRDQIIPLVRPECSDEIDNDGDGYVDYPEDASCHSSSGLKEAGAVP